MDLRILHRLGWQGVAFLALLWLGVFWRAHGQNWTIDLNAEPNARVLSAMDLAIVRADAKVDVKPLVTGGAKLLARVELVTGAGGNITLKPAMKEVVARGFAGVALYLGEGSAPKAAMVAGSIKKLRADFPKATLLAGMPLALLEGSLASLPDGWISLPGKGMEDRLAEIKQAVSAGWKVYAVDVAGRTDLPLAAQRAAALRQAGALPFVTTKEMLGIALAPWRVVPRRILVLFGTGDPVAGEPPSFEADTLTATRLQMALEWMGYEVDYFHVAKGLPPETLQASYAGIIFDSRLSLPFSKERAFADWTLRQRNEGMKLLFVGQYPFVQEVELNRVLLGLGMRGSYAGVKSPQQLKITDLDAAVMNFEAEVQPKAVDFAHIQAPQNASVALGLDAVDSRANPVHFDPVFTAPWGGAVLDPYLTSQVSGAVVRSYFDPFALLARIWPEGQFPAPDTTTRCGERIFYSHIDGDGFVYETAYDSKKLCGEVIRDEILKKYDFPVTCSVIEAEIRAWQLDLKQEESARFLATARSMFALPNVQAASHSFSHPFIWIDADEDYLTLYDERNLKLKPEAAYPKIDMRREVAGSISYIEKELLPKGRKVELMLWSGNCRPGAEALRVCEELGILNMNGGNTSITKRHEAVSNIGPNRMTWQGLQQIHASNQNEFVYTRNWNGPFYGGFRQVLETFSLTEKPRRLKPVNVYYHFYSAAQVGSLKALKEVLDWCTEQPLHAITAREYAEIVTDASDTVVLQLGEGAWQILTSGNLRTLRLPASFDDLDLEKCRGILGWRRTPQGLYVHLTGEVKVAVISANPSEKNQKNPMTSLPYLVSSSSPIRSFERTANSVCFTVDDFRAESQVCLGGFVPGSIWELEEEPSPQRLTADPEGQLRIRREGRSKTMLRAVP